MLGKVIALSGAFAPLHIGHVRMLNHAASYGQVIVILNSDEWLQRNKGYIFMPFEERQEILLSLRSVATVRQVNDSDDTVCEAIKRIMPNYFGKGGSSTEKNTPEKELCDRLGIETIFNLGGPQNITSDDLIKRLLEKKPI